jgi:hypothetical protein
METGAIVGVTVQGADQGDATTIAETVTTATEELEAVAAATDGETAVIDEVVADKGYHSNQVVVDLAALSLRTYIAEPARGRRRWKKKAAARRCLREPPARPRKARAALQRRRSERSEPPNAHLYAELIVVNDGAPQPGEVGDGEEVVVRATGPAVRHHHWRCARAQAAGDPKPRLPLTEVDGAVGGRVEKRPGRRLIHAGRRLGNHLRSL